MRHQVLEGAGLDGAPAVFVKDSEGHPYHVFVVDGPHFGRHHVAKLRKLNLTRTVCVVLKEFLFKISLPIFFKRNLRFGLNFPGFSPLKKACPYQNR